MSGDLFSRLKLCLEVLVGPVKLTKIAFSNNLEIDADSRIIL